jgi:hypothetical protein
VYRITEGEAPSDYFDTNDYFPEADIPSIGDTMSVDGVTVVVTDVQLTPRVGEYLEYTVTYDNAMTAEAEEETELGFDDYWQGPVDEYTIRPEFGTRTERVYRPKESWVDSTVYSEASMPYPAANGQGIEVTFPVAGFRVITWKSYASDPSISNLFSDFEYISKINSWPFLGEAAKTILCTNYDFRKVGETSDGDTVIERTYTMEYRPLVALAEGYGTVYGSPWHQYWQLTDRVMVGGGSLAKFREPGGGGYHAYRVFDSIDFRDITSGLTETLVEG